MEFKSHVGYHIESSTHSLMGSPLMLTQASYRRHQNIAISRVCEGGCNLRDDIFLVCECVQRCGALFCIFYHIYTIILNNIQLIKTEHKKKTKQKRDFYYYYYYKFLLHTSKKKRPYEVLHDFIELDWCNIIKIINV